MKSLKNSEAIGGLLAALAHGDIQPRQLWRRPEFWDWKLVKQQKPRKARAVRALPPRIEFFEGADLEMLPPTKPAPPRKVTSLLPSQLDRIFEERERVRKLGEALRITYDQIDAAQEDLAAIRARIHFLWGLR